jgi:hypothetical protein
MPTNDTIQSAFALMLPALAKRYGRAEGCTRAQVTKTAKALRISEDIFPYVCAAFLSEDEFRLLQQEMSGVGWGEVQKKCKYAVRELGKAKPQFGGFYDSTS